MSDVIPYTHHTIDLGEKLETILLDVLHKNSYMKHNSHTLNAMRLSALGTVTNMDSDTHKER